MLKYIGKRLIMLIPVILVTSFLIFWAMSLTGGDTSKYMEGYSGYDICPVRHVHAKLLVGTHADHHIFTEAGSVSNGR